MNKIVDENIKGTNYLNNKNLIKFIGNVDEKLIKELIVEHLIRKGNIKTVQRYLEESKLEMDTLTKDILIFQEYYDIINDLNDNKIKKLYDWCSKNRDILLKNTENINGNKIKDENMDNKNIFIEFII